MRRVITEPNRLWVLGSEFGTDEVMVMSYRALLAASVVSVGLSFGTPAAAAEETWHERYERAQELLVQGEEGRAAGEFDALAKTAKTPEDRAVAEEMAKVARARVAYEARRPVTGHLRTSDELSLLYTTAFAYGFGTSAWLALQVQPKNLATAVIPFVVITSAAVGGVAVADDYRPFRLGVPQSIAAGMFLGVGEGAWLVGYQHAAATRRDDDSRWKAPTVSTVLWAGATLGGLTGGLLGAWREPTPGRVSFAASASLWPGFVASMGAAALRDGERRNETAFAAGALAYNLGLGAAIAFGPDLSPSVARVRFVDLGGLAGCLLGVSSYLLATGSDNSARGGLAAAALGSTAGLAVSWWATSGMKPEVRAPDEPTSAFRMSPVFAPIEHGWTVGVAGTL
jgi:hypothetical protein